jgi:hypothetical protein
VAVVIALGVGGGLLGLAIIFCDYWWSKPPGSYTGTGEFKLWLFLSVVQPAIWGAALVPLWSILRSLRQHWAPNKREIVATSAVFAALVLSFIVGSTSLSPIPNPLPHFQAKLLVLSLLAAAVGIAGAVGISLVHAALEGFAGREGSAETLLADYLRLREQLRRLLAIEGIIIGAAVLASGALRHAVLSYAPSANVHFLEPGMFPPEYILIYGAYFSGLLVLLYAPTFNRFLAVGRALRDRYASLGPPDSEGWSAAYDRRRKLEDLLELGMTTTGSFRTGVAIFAPLASGFLGLLVGGK